MPPARSATCRYISDWVTVKTRWGLSANQVEHDAIDRIDADCYNPRITVTRAR
ncbi:hypothetical protein OIE62_41600 (plasmid) [Streptomyces scopuliridis]|uniref:Uncharacterized protein n=1 Tax=Streptomyces scopuliridis TaxID=452529 RepID=A0ACD4ZYD1_9ACTN|nr:hypothetical protein [Streptomyces scopuliridis]WSC03455.1 hypothetical protein OG835_41890 [Streptomyces scopuliridis]WSC11401.1 hypothetical protein OIE62_41600 [Streptomyces scopuliridis]